MAIDEIRKLEILRKKQKCWGVADLAVAVPLLFFGGLKGNPLMLVLGMATLLFGLRSWRWKPRSRLSGLRRELLERRYGLTMTGRRMPSTGEETLWSLTGTAGGVPVTAGETAAGRLLTEFPLARPGAKACRLPGGDAAPAIARLFDALPPGTLLQADDAAIRLSLPEDGYRGGPVTVEVVERPLGCFAEAVAAVAQFARENGVPPVS